MAVYDYGRQGAATGDGWQLYGDLDADGAGHFAPQDWSETPQDSDDNAPRGGFGGAVQRFTNVAGALVSVALIAGLGFWGYKLLVRDVTGVPVVAALEGPMRMAPENPGGQQAAHQGLAVNAIAAEGEAAPPADRLVLAPRGIGLSDEDQPQAALAPQLQAVDEPAIAPTVSAQPGGVLAANDADMAPPDAMIVAADPADTAPAPEALPSGRDPMQVALALAEMIAADSMDGPDAAPAPGSGFAGFRSPVPQPRPAHLRTNAAVAPTPVALRSTPELDAATLPAGTRLVQFGAYDTPEQARAEWDRLAARFGDYLAGKSRVVQQAQSGGNTFYRLRAAGFADLADTQRFCAALVAENAACVPATSR